MSEELSLRIPHLTLTALAWGPPEGLRVLAVHGWLDNAASFEPLVPHLSACRIVALDLPGHGRSSWRPVGTHYHFVDFVPDVLEAANALGWDRFVLLGHSLGASIAAFTAASAPERIERLILIEGIGPWSGEPLDAPVQLAQSMEQTRQQKRSPRYRDTATAVEARRRAGDLSHAAALKLAQRGLQPVDGGVNWRTDPMLTVRSPIYVTEEQVLAFLAAIRAPTLFIQAEAGLMVRRENTLHRMRQIAGLRTRTLAGGHHLHMDDPGPTANAILDFLTD